ncbi:3-dehydrosphinganine reductase [Naganishia albida]|nr:3-dehydrosphinganine reductase [Naganishia albida]
MPWFWRTKLAFAGKHCYVTGGSSGLGLALSEYLASQGAHVTIVARDVKKLEEAKLRIETHRTSESQKIVSISADLTRQADSARAYQDAIAQHGGAEPSNVFLCAGHAKPGFFIETDESDLRSGLDGTYWVSAWTAQVAGKAMMAANGGGRIVFVGSFLALTTFVGYAGYAPGKYALKGLADTLRSEYLLYNINVHLYLPAGILSPNYEVENRTKPDITKKIEEGDTPMTPEDCVKCLINGLERGYFQITNDMITDILRVASRGNAPGNNVIWDTCLVVIAAIGVPIWRMIIDYQVKGHRARHAERMKLSSGRVS